jgi:hypothetical protein
MTEQLRQQTPQEAERRPMSRLARPSAGGVQQQNAQPRHRQFGRVRAAGGFTYCGQTSAEEVRSPAFRSARPLSHGACARCACRSQLAQNAVDMLSYPQGTGPLTTTPHRALQMVRENLDYLERFLGPRSGHDPGPTRPS